MSEPTSARPEKLDGFVGESRAARAAFEDELGRARRAYDAFIAAGGGQFVSDGGLVHTTLAALTDAFAATEELVRITREAVVRADAAAVDGTVTIASTSLLAAMEQVARESGRSLEDLIAANGPIDVAPVEVGTNPQHAGYVNDPVCTATGHFLEIEEDLVVPDRVRHLGWVRRYSSRLLQGNAHGRGWWTWADARVDLGDAGLLVVGPDGRHVWFPTPTDGPVAAVGADVTARVDGTTTTVQWGGRSPQPGETWVFENGRIVRCEDPYRGTTTFTHVDDRLVALGHEGGRRLDLTWDGDRVAAVEDDHGRRAVFTYGDAGDLTAVERDSGGRTYAADEDGRIVEVHDADGVRLCLNRYDADGRVRRQLEPTGRVTVFRYLPGRVTEVRDHATGLVTTFEHDELGRVVRMEADGAHLEREFDADGRVVRLRSHDGSGFVSEGGIGPSLEQTVRHDDGTVEVFTYDEHVRLVAHRVDDGPTTRWSYDGDAPQPTAVDVAGATTHLAWDRPGVLREVVDADGVRTELTADAEGLPVETTDAAGNRVAVQLHPSGAPTRVELPDGGVVEADLDGAGRPLRLRDVTGGELTLQWTPAGRLAGTTDSTGRTTSLVWGGDGLVERVEVDGEVALDVAHDLQGRIDQLADAAGGRWAFDWSSLGVLTGLTTPAGRTWTAELDERHRVAATVDADGTRREALVGEDGVRIGTVDAAGARTATRDQSGAVVLRAPGRSAVLLEPDEQGRIARRTDADGRTTTLDWTPGGRLAAVESAGRRTEHAYDARGERVTTVVTDGDVSRRWSVERDWRGAVTRITTPSGRTTTHERDVAGRVVATTTGGGRRTWTYDEQGGVAAATTAAGATIHLRRDAAGRVERIDAPWGDVAFEHDRRGDVVAQVDELGGRLSFDRDADGQVAARTDQLGRTTRFERHADGAVRTTLLPDGTRVEHLRDAAGRLDRTVVDGVETVWWRRDERGFLARVEDLARGRTIDLDHTDGGRLASWTESDGTAIAWDHEVPGRTRRSGDRVPDLDLVHGLARDEGTLGGTRLRVDRDGDGLLTGVTADDRALRVERDTAGAIVRVDEDGATTTLERDAAGRVVRRTGPDGDVQTFTYDEAGRLATVEVDGETTTYRWDAVGRLVEEVSPAGTTTYVHDAAHQLTQVRNPDGTVVRHVHDERGRRIREERADGVRAYEWDAENRLVAIVDDGRRLEVEVDAFGLLRRVGDRTVAWDHGSYAVPVPAAVDGRPVFASGRAVLVDDGAPVASALVGPAGPTPWGRVSDDDTLQTDTGIVGGIGFAGLVWLGARVYDPSTRRFLTPDPLAGAAGSPTCSNPYAYADADPINRIDPSGLCGAPMSLAEFERMNDAATGMQWDNIVEAGLAVGSAVAMGVLVATPGVNLIALAAAGFVLGGASAGVPALMRGDEDWGRKALTGAVVGAIAGPVGRVFNPTFASRATSVLGNGAIGAGEGFVSTVVAESSDAMFGDGRFEWDEVGRGTAFGAVGGSVSGAVTYRPGAPHTGPSIEVEEAAGMHVQTTPASINGASSPTAPVVVPTAPSAPTRPGSGVFRVEGANGVYIGQSADIDTYLPEVGRAHGFTPDELASAQRIDVAGGAADRQAVQQVAINAERAAGSSLLNQRNVMSEERLRVTLQGGSDG